MPELPWCNYIGGRWSCVRSDEQNRTNKREHALSFETARLVSAAPVALTRHDPHADGGRWQTIGSTAPCS